MGKNRNVKTSKGAPPKSMPTVSKKDQDILMKQFDQVEVQKLAQALDDLDQKSGFISVRDLQNDKLLAFIFGVVVGIFTTLLVN